MRKWLSLLLALSLVALLTACGAAGKDIVAEVGGVQITKAEAQNVLDFMLKYQQVINGQDTSDTALVNQLKLEVINALTEMLAIEQKLTSLGQGLTDADTAQIEKTAQDAYGALIQSNVDAYGITAEEAGAEAEAAGLSLQTMRFYARRDMLDTKLRDITPVTAEVTDEEVAEVFDLAIEEDMARYTQSPGQFSVDSLNGEIILYRPEGYRYIKNLVIPFPDEIEEQLSGKRDEVYQIGYSQYMVQNELTTYAEEMTDDEKADANNYLLTLDGEYTRLMGEIDALKREGLEAIRAEAEAILIKCQAPGADFDAVMAEYNADTATGDMLTLGYPVSAESTSYVESFTEGAMAIPAVGDLSGLIESEYGFHILKYAGDIPSGPVPLDEVREDIRAVLLEQAKDEAYGALVDQYLDEANIKTYLSNF